MALETIKGLKSINGVEIVDMNALKEQYPEKFNSSGSMDFKWFESEIRPNKFIYVRHDKNSLSVTLQNGPIGEVGVNGCQVTDLLALIGKIYEGLNSNFPSRDNAMTITKIDEALMWQDKRTKDREDRGVEGKNEL